MNNYLWEKTFTKKCHDIHILHALTPNLIDVCITNNQTINLTYVCV